jgi:hypothetical protein
MTTSFKVAVKADSTNTWASNQWRFATREAAEEYGSNLAMRWLAVREWEVQESDDEVNR